MSMVTSCPACTTTFRVTQDQLKHRQGKVRCGKCSGVFDAFKTLATLPDEPTVSAPELESPDTPAMRTSAGAAQGSLDIDSYAGANLGADLGARGERSGLARARALWYLIVMVLLIALLLQLVYAFRDAIGAALPRAQPLLERMCDLAGCAVSPPKRSDQLAIDASDLQADPARPNVIVLTAALRNRGRALVAHPALELTLTNAQDQAIARRIFLPEDYLPRPADAKSGMPALAEIDVRLELDTGDLKPAGYRLFLFYP